MLNKEITFSIATEDDWNALAEFRNIYSKEGLEFSKSQFNRNFIDDPQRLRSQIFKAELNAQIVGYGRCEYFNPVEGKTLYGLGDELPEGIYLSGLLVHEDVRGLKVGLELTKLRIDWSRERSESLYCYIQENNVPSVKMHEKIGYKIIKKGLKYPSDQEGEFSGVLFRYDSSLYKVF